MKFTIDTAKVTEPVGTFFGDLRKGLREARLNAKARAFNRKMANLGAILERASELSDREEIAAATEVKRAARKARGTKKVVADQHVAK